MKQGNGLQLNDPNAPCIGVNRRTPPTYDELRAGFADEIASWATHPPLDKLRLGMTVYLKGEGDRLLPAVVSCIADNRSGLCCLAVYGIMNLGEPPVFNLWARYDYEAEESDVVGVEKYSRGKWSFMEE